MKDTGHIIIDTSDEPWWNFKAELHLERNGPKCEWIVSAWITSDKSKYYGAKFTSYRKAWKAYENALNEIERRYNWKAHFDNEAWRAAHPNAGPDADAEALLAGLEDL